MTNYISPCIKTGIHVNNLKTTGENDLKHLKIFCNQYQNRLHRVSASRAYKLSTLLTLESILFKSSFKELFSHHILLLLKWILMSSFKKNLLKGLFYFLFRDWKIMFRIVTCRSRVKMPDSKSKAEQRSDKFLEIFREILITTPHFDWTLIHQLNFTNMETDCTTNSYTGLRDTIFGSDWSARCQDVVCMSVCACVWDIMLKSTPKEVLATLKA